MFVFKQKAAYELRISDWSSDVCSSDLHAGEDHLARRDRHVALRQAAREGPLHLALGEGRRGVADEFAACLPARRDRLAQPAVFLAATECRIAGKVGAFPA